MPNFFNSYADVKKHWDTTKPWRGSDDRPWSLRTHNHKRMTMNGRGDITLSFHSSELITYHVDGTITLRPHVSGSYMQAHIVSAMVPDGIAHANHECRVGTHTMTAPFAQVDYETRYSWARFPFWVDNPDYVPPPGDQRHYAPGSRIRNPDIRVYRCNHVLRLKRGPERWEPVDLAACEPFTWQEINQSKSRKAAAQSGLRDFTAWFEAYDRLRGDEDLPPYERGVDADTLLTLMDEQRYLEALACFPRSRSWNYAQHGYQENGIQRSYLQKLRTLLYEREGTTELRSEPVLTLPQFETCKGLMRRFA